MTSVRFAEYQDACQFSYHVKEFRIGELRDGGTTDFRKTGKRDAAALSASRISVVGEARADTAVDCASAHAFGKNRACFWSGYGA
jgi:hypothetical protein